MEKYFTAGQTTDDNMTHALCMLDILGYKHTLTICNKYIFFTATAGQTTDDNMTHALCMLDTLGYKHTLTICNKYIFFPLQQWLYQGAPILLYAYFVCLVKFVFCYPHLSFSFT